MYVLYMNKSMRTQINSSIGAVEGKNTLVDEKWAALDGIWTHDTTSDISSDVCIDS